MRDEVLLAVQALGAVADSLAITTAQLSLAWVLSRPTVSFAIICASSPEQVRENAIAVGVRLDPQDHDAIDKAINVVVFFERPTGTN